jgi:hypothetical protein
MRINEELLERIAALVQKTEINGHGVFAALTSNTPLSAGVGTKIR